MDFIPIRVVNIKDYSLDRKSLHDWAEGQLTERTCSFCESRPGPLLYIRDELEAYPVFVCETHHAIIDRMSRWTMNELNRLYNADRRAGKTLGDSVEIVYAICLLKGRLRDQDPEYAELLRLIRKGSR